jgi:hypothetical protein
MEGTGSRDGREVLVALEAIRGESRLERLHDGRYHLSTEKP